MTPNQMSSATESTQRMSADEIRTLPVVSRFKSFCDTRQMIHNPIAVFSKYTAHLGDTFGFYFGGVKRAIISSNPAVIQRVLKTNYENYHKSEIQMKRMQGFLGKGLLTTHDEPWRTQRRLIQRGFHRDELAALTPVMYESLCESLEQFDREVKCGSVDIYSQMTQITFRMVARSLFSAEFKDEDIEFISRVISTVQEFMVRQIVHPYLDLWFSISGEWAKHQALRRKGDTILLNYIQRRRCGPQVSADLLQILLDARYADTGKGMDDEVILSESMQLLVAGHETSSNALSWMLYLLSQHPEYIRRIRQELIETLRSNRIQYSDLPKLEFTTQVVEETLRLYPPFWMVDRVALDDDQVEDFAITKGTMIVLFIYGAHHSTLYWNDAEHFDPERFGKENKKKHKPCSYLPFGGGPRSCIGGNYAMLQMMMILGELVRRYDFQLVADQIVETRPMIILRPKAGICMRFEKR